MTFRRYLVLAAVVICGSFGDVMLSRGMKLVGVISHERFADLIFAVFNPWVALGILFLLCYFASYSTALSWADLTYVLPATSLSYILIAFLSLFLLDENISMTRWLGILLVSCGVGVVAGGPSLTQHHPVSSVAPIVPNLSPATPPAEGGDA